jgi:hypothetical protein
VLIGQPMPGKVTEGGDRLARFRTLLTDLVNGAIAVDEAYRQTGLQLPRHTSPHANSNRVFPSGWEERLVRTQLSRLYNQAVLEALRDAGQNSCFVPHSSAEDAGTACSVQLAGKAHEVSVLYDRLVQSYTYGQWSSQVKVPDHPHCTHVVRPVPG